MGRFVNPDNSAFQVALNSRIYVDKTGLIEYTNSVLDTTNAYICNSRPRRFGKSYAANMLAAYYSKGTDSEQMLSGSEVKVDTATVKNDPAKIQNRDDVITYLIHLGYLGYNEDSESAFVPNEEIRQELITAVRSSNWDELIAFQQESRKLLTATLSMDEKQVAAEIDKFHSQYTSMIQYNDENSLSSIITIAYLGAMQD